MAPSKDSPPSTNKNERAALSSGIRTHSANRSTRLTPITSESAIPSRVETNCSVHINERRPNARGRNTGRIAASARLAAVIAFPYHFRWTGTVPARIIRTAASRVPANARFAIPPTSIATSIIVASNFRVQRRPQAVRWNESLDTRRYCGRVGVRGQPLLPKGPTENRQGEAPASTEAAWRPIQVNLIGALRLRCSRNFGFAIFAFGTGFARLGASFVPIFAQVPAESNDPVERSAECAGRPLADNRRHQLRSSWIPSYSARTGC